MKKQKLVYRYVRYDGKALDAKREVSYELKLSSRMLLDELCFNWNKERLETAINSSIDTGNKKKFFQLSKEYRHYIWE
ncbi:IDEAL domain-containing protein [Virgibacillus subterraneus]|uniref:IDEAL domain-containing protein n=2 Tax=Virgibacillus TaxID=84406 RepID=A0A1H1EA07_9BACI|nr:MULTISPECIES: IDEAL domain-containing protein [Virgibacillus]SDQ85602.1 IDEAL domain-containing protein [Virgibacillus salinus]SEQ40522.1 IDEAL domain-containing protein [Virgibacillus subterraneus]